MAKTKYTLFLDIFFPLNILYFFLKRKKNEINKKMTPFLKSTVFAILSKKKINKNSKKIRDSKKKSKYRPSSKFLNRILLSNSYKHIVC